LGVRTSKDHAGAGSEAARLATKTGTLVAGRESYGFSVAVREQGNRERQIDTEERENEVAACSYRS